MNSRLGGKVSILSPVPDTVRQQGGGSGLPLFAWPVQAGFPSPADDYMEGHLDLNSHVIGNRAATFFVKAAGVSMTGAGIHPGDILVVDRSLEAVDGKVVVAAVDGEFTLKRLCRRDGAAWLVPENDAFEPIRLDEGSDLVIWGVVTFVVHRVV